MYCTINNFIANVTVASSVFTLVAISLDRYLTQFALIILIFYCFFLLFCFKIHGNCLSTTSANVQIYCSDGHRYHLGGQHHPGHSMSALLQDHLTQVTCIVPTRSLVTIQARLLHLFLSSLGQLLFYLRTEKKMYRKNHNFDHKNQNFDLTLNV